MKKTAENVLKLFIIMSSLTFLSYVALRDSPAEARKKEIAAEKSKKEWDCISEHLGKYSSIQTARTVVAVNFIQMDKQHLLKYITDAEAVRMTYCNEK